MLMKYFFKRDTLLATIAVFVVMGLLALIPLNTHLFDPLKAALADVNFNDLSFSALKLHKVNPVEKDIVIVNIEHADRKKIATALNRVEETEARVIGLDVLFDGPSDSTSDSILAYAIRNNEKLVVSNNFSEEGESKMLANYFDPENRKSGFVNFIGEDAGVIRYFSPFERIPDAVYPSFSSAIVKEADPEKYTILANRKNDIEIINYSRDLEQYFIVTIDDVIENKVSKELFNDKIVLMGYIRESPFDIEDCHFTPLNEKFMGKSLPDMNGVLIHANIISMLLNEKYISKLPQWVNILVALLSTWFFMSLFIKYYLSKSLWFHLITKLIQLLATILIIYLGILMQKYFSISLSLALLLVGLILSTDVLYFYEAGALWCNRKFGYKTIFTHATSHS